jgi:monoamine oxidase
MTATSQIDYLSLIRSGLPPTGAPQKVIIVGAGMAGLVAADLLLKAGHDPVVLEAQERVGGRVYTMREPFTHGLHAEAGAMRIPRAHELTMELIRKFNLPTADFTMGNPNNYTYYGGVKRRMSKLTRRCSRSRYR